MIPPAFVTSAIRTAVSYAVAWLLSLPFAGPAEQLLGVSSTTARTRVVAAGVFVVGTLWYLLVRALEAKWPAAGWLLGVPAKPAYSAEDLEDLTLRAPAPLQARGPAPPGPTAS